MPAPSFVKELRGLANNPLRNLERKSKGWIRILLLIIPYFIVVGTFLMLGGVLIGVDYSQSDPVLSSGQELGLSFFDLLGTLLVLWVFMKYVDRESFVKLGFQIKNRTREFFFGILLGAVLMGAGLLFLLGLNEIGIKEVDFEPTPFIVSVLLFANVALAEEVLFRGYIQKNLMLSFNKPVALFISSIIFSLAHGANPNLDMFSLFELFLAGILLGVSYLYTKNLWFPIALHFSWNLFQSLFGFNVSGQDFYSIIELNYDSGNLLNGGAFGFEGSILSAILSIMTIVLIIYYYQKNSEQATPKEAYLNIPLRNG